MDHLHLLAIMKPGINDYTDAGSTRKDRLHRSGRAFLKRLAADLGLKPGEFDVRSNLGGMAVSGEVTLHSDRIYVQLSEHFATERRGVSALYRHCNGRQDYSGGRNHRVAVSKVAQRYPAFVAELLALSATLQAA